MKTERPAKICLVCKGVWRPKDRFQAIKGKTCSKECFKTLLRSQKIGKPLGERVQRLETPCAHCGTIVRRRPKQVMVNKSIYCSGSCRAKAHVVYLIPHSGKGRGGWTERSQQSYLQKMTGSGNPAWRGGVTYSRTKGNYQRVKYVRCPPEFLSMARKDGYVMEHRLIMARWIGRPLIRTEVVHHGDHIVSNNARANLELWPNNRSHKLMEHGRCAEGAANRVFLTGSEPL